MSKIFTRCEAHQQTDRLSRTLEVHRASTWAQAGDRLPVSLSNHLTPSNSMEAALLRKD
jgi:hypothetical protein